MAPEVDLIVEVSPRRRRVLVPSHIEPAWAQRHDVRVIADDVIWGLAHRRRDRPEQDERARGYMSPRRRWSRVAMLVPPLRRSRSRANAYLRKCAHEQIDFTARDFVAAMRRQSRRETLHDTQAVGRYHEQSNLSKSVSKTNTAP